MSVASIAAYLAGLRLEGRTVPELPAEQMPGSLEDAYRVQSLVVDALCRAWAGTRAGYKVALTNPAAQAMLGVPHPVFGRLVSSRVHASGAVLAAADYAVRIVEVEIGFRLRRDVPGSQTYDRATIAPYVAALYPSIEIVEHHFAAIDRVTPESLAADNAIHGAWVHGDPVTEWSGIDLAAQPTRLVVNGEEALTGTGGRVLGHPLEALAWLANALPRHGLALRQGDYVTTGVTTDKVYSARAGDDLLADFPGLGRVSLRFV